MQEPESVRALLRARGPEMVAKCLDGANATAEALAAELARHNDPKDVHLMSINDLTKAGNFFLMFKAAATPIEDGEVFIGDLKITKGKGD